MLPYLAGPSLPSSFSEQSKHAFCSLWIDGKVLIGLFSLLETFVVIHRVCEAASWISAERQGKRKQTTLGLHKCELHWKR